MDDHSHFTLSSFRLKNYDVQRKSVRRWNFGIEEEKRKRKKTHPRRKSAHSFLAHRFHSIVWQLIDFRATFIRLFIMSFDTIEIETD